MKLGRNDPCHCGSGQKYKKCHMDLDVSRDREERSLATLPAWVGFHARSLREAVQAIEGPRLVERAQSGFPAVAGDEPFAHPYVAQHLCYDLRAVGERPAITRVAVTDPDRTGLRKRALQQCLAASHASILEVTEVKRGRGVRLKDRLLDRERFVADPALSMNVDPLEVIVGRLVQFERTWLLLDGFIKVPFRQRKAVIADLRGALDDAIGPMQAGMPEDVEEEDESVEEGAGEELEEGAEPVAPAPAKPARPVNPVVAAQVEARISWLKAAAPRLLLRLNEAAQQ